MTSRSHAAVGRWIGRELETAPPRAKSLVVTVWGDALAPHGGAVWLSGLIRLLAPLGLNERLVRTSVYRLARDGWLASRQAGRRSLYRLTAQGRRRFESAYRRIYAAPSEAWDGDWDLGSLDAGYRRFIGRFRRVVELFRDDPLPDPGQCFVVRTLLIHEYRRVTLHDPQLPPAMLPARWHARDAYVLCRDFYRLTHRCAEQHLAATLEAGSGPLPPAAPYFYQRFGG